MSNYPENFIKEVLGSEDQYELNYFDKTLEFLEGKLKLNERQIDILHSRYEKGLSLAEIGLKYGITRERVRQIQKSILKKFRKPEISIYLKYGLEGVKQIELENAKKISSVDSNIDVLNLSHRSTRYLKENGIIKVSQLMKMSEYDILKIKNLGTICAKEIIEKLNSNGFGHYTRSVNQDVYEILDKYNLTKDELIEKIKEI